MIFKTLGNCVGVEVVADDGCSIQQTELNDTTQEVISFSFFPVMSWLFWFMLWFALWKPIKHIKKLF